LKERHPYKTEVEIGKLISQITEGYLTLEDWYWHKTVEKMYEPTEAEYLL
jgi:hypothetical protein